MDHAYRSPAYSSLERRAIDLALRCKERHDALELAADCQRLLEGAGFARVWGTMDAKMDAKQAEGGTTREPWRYISTQELYYCKEDALVLICYTLPHLPIPSYPEKIACSFLKPANVEIGILFELKAQTAHSLFDIADILLRRREELHKVRQKIDRRGIHDFEDALLHAVRYSHCITSPVASGKTK